MLRNALLALALAAALALAGCGDDDDDGGATTGDAATTTTDRAEGDGAPPAAELEVSELTAFASPDGNIGCEIDRESVRCDIAERDWKPPPAPKDCDLDYGQGVELTAGGTADLVCAGDSTLEGEGSPLPPGEAIAAGLLRCENRREAIRCRDVESGRGFAISREDYELF